MPSARLAELDEALGLTNSRNSETLFAWLQLALANRYQPAVPAAERFLLSMGRAKFVAPLFKTLIGEDAWGKAIAEPLYAKAKPGYHSVTSGRVDKLMSGEED
jgi:leukotriene-A4 hydrolase